MGNTEMVGVAGWASVPDCLLQLDRQLRSVMVDPRHENVPLLGPADDGAFVLGYVQVSNMPHPLKTRAVRSELDKANVQTTGRNLGLHNDPAHYGDVIVTVTLFGHVQILLKRDPLIHSDLQGMERGPGTLAGDVLIDVGDAYGIWGKARYKMKHGERQRHSKYAP
jgi:hypothetical protein